MDSDFRENQGAVDRAEDGKQDGKALPSGSTGGGAGHVSQDARGAGNNGKSLKERSGDEGLVSAGHDSDPAAHLLEQRLESARPPVVTTGGIGQEGQCTIQDEVTEQQLKAAGWRRPRVCLIWDSDDPPRVNVTRERDKAHDVKQLNVRAWEQDHDAIRDIATISRSEKAQLVGAARRFLQSGLFKTAMEVLGMVEDYDKLIEKVSRSDPADLRQVSEKP